MSIKISNKQIAVSVGALNYLANSVALPPKPGFQIGHAQRLLTPAFQAYEEQRIKLVEKFSKKDADDKPVKKPLPAGAAPGTPEEADIEDQAGFDAAIAELQSAEVEIAVSPIKVDSLGETILPPFVFGALEWLITE